MAKKIKDHITSSVHKRAYKDAKLELKVHLSELGKDAIEHIGNLGYDPVYGARPLKRAIQDSLENPLSKALLAGQFSNGDHIMVTYKDGLLSFNKK